MTHTCLKRPVLKLSECTWVWGATQRPEKETQRTVLRNWETTPTVLARFARVFLLGQTYTLPAYAHKNWKTPQCKPQNPRGAVSPLDGRRDTALGHFCFFSVQAYKRTRFRCETWKTLSANPRTFRCAVFPVGGRAHP